MNVKIEDLKVTGFNSSWIFPDQSVWRISLCEMLIPKNTALLDIILICGQNMAILYVWKTRKKSQLTKKAKPWWSLSLCVYIYANMWIYHYLKHKIILLWLEIYFLCILYMPFICYLTPQTILDIETWSKSSIRVAIIFVFLLIILVLETR